MEPPEVACPVCGGGLGEIDTLIGLAIVGTIEPDGTLTWAGETKIDWDTQAPENNPPIFECLECSRHFTYDKAKRQFNEITED
jgi:hypothetical protein